MDKKLEKSSKFLSYILRHHPEEFGLDHDEYGNINVDKLIKATDFTKESLEHLVSEETRYAFSDDKTLIRALHGHSYPVIYINKVTPPDELYHGTAERFMDLIMKDGYIKGMSRTQVHLSDSVEMAKTVASRHGKPVILVLDIKQMLKDNIAIYKSEDGVYLTNDIPVKYIKQTIK